MKQLQNTVVTVGQNVTPLPSQDCKDHQRYHAEVECMAQSEQTGQSICPANPLIIDQPSPIEICIEKVNANDGHRQRHHIINRLVCAMHSARANVVMVKNSHETLCPLVRIIAPM